MESRSQKKKSRKGLWIGIGVVAAVIVAGAGYFGYTKYQEAQTLKANEAVLKKFTTAIKEQKFTDLNKLIAGNKKDNSNYASADIQQKYQNVFDGIAAQNIKVKQQKVTKESDGSYAFSYKLSLTTSLGELKNLSYKGNLKEENGEAKIKWAPNLIFPQMSGEDKVSVTVNQPIRGQITDRNGKGLATNETFQQLGVVLSKLGEGEEKTANIKAIAEVYNLTEEEITEAISQSWVQPDYFVPLKVLEMNERVTELPTGSGTQDVTLRYYSLGEAGAQLLGYVGNVSAEDIEKNPELPSDGQIGKTGLEAAFDEKLRGQAGGSITITDEEGKEKEVLQKVEEANGENVQLTLDYEAQKTAYEELGSQAGATVAMNPTTGDLLAVVSSPSYDPNKMAHGISQEEYDKYNNDSLHPFTSRFANRYAPGSTFKTITAAVGLDAGTIDPSEALSISGLKWQKDASWGDYQVTRVSDVASVNLQAALVYSDNIYMAQQTLKMGEKTFTDGLKKFIFGEELDLPIDMNEAQISNDGSLSKEILLADTGYGQGELLINPIQQATMYTVFCNSGTLVYPRLLMSADEARTKADVISANAADTINTDLQAVVSDANGTAHSLASLNIPLAAKTGTAEIKEEQDKDGQENSFLLAYNPEQKNYLVVNFLDNRGEGESAIGHSQNLLTYLNGLQ